jgi:hypothetical protein
MKLFECSKCSQRWLGMRAPVCPFDGGLAWEIPMEKTK